MASMIVDLPDAFGPVNNVLPLISTVSFAR
jgi:hypothetical protein